MKKFKLLVLALMVISCLGLFSACDGGEDYDLVVKAGDSIQTAIDSARVGDEILVKAGSYDENITVDKKITLVGETNTVLTGEISVTANDATFSHLNIRHKYEDATRTDSKFVISGMDFTLEYSLVERTTGASNVYGDIITYTNPLGTLDIEHSTLIAPVAGTREHINEISASVIGGIAGAQAMQSLDVEYTTIKTNGYAVFDRFNFAEYNHVTFTGLDAGTNISGVSVLKCPTAVNNVHCEDVKFEHCTFKNMSNGATFLTGGKIEFDDNNFLDIEFESALGGVLVFCGDWQGAQYEKLSSVVIKDNTFDLTKIGQGITFYYVFNPNSIVRIDHNTFKNCVKEDGQYRYTILNAREEGGKNVSATRSVFQNCTDDPQIRQVQNMEDVSRGV